MMDFITVVSTLGPTLTKTYKSDGSVEPYGDAASFKVHQYAVSNLAELSEKLTKLETKHTGCVIRGKFIGPDHAEKGSKSGTFKRNNNNFTDCPHHWFMVDIDKYEPGFADPVHEPVDAIKDFIAEQLPAFFKDVSFHWQLSSSAGMPGKEHILKAHVWFWSDTPYTSADMYAWAQTIGPRVDKAVYRRVQAHYTASPIFEEGVTDPVPVRSGLYQGARDSVPFKISSDIIEAARATGSGSGGKDMKLVDPSEKDGLVGAYHRTYTPDVVLLEHLEGQFAEGSNDRRWTWLEGGGTPEGVWVHDDGMHVGATHNTWPIDGVANLWDLVRVLKFGHLDKSSDDFEQESIDDLPIQAKPSNLAMLKWAAQLPELMEQVKSERRSLMDTLRKKVDEAEDPNAIELNVAPEIRETLGLSSIDREQLAVAIQARLKTLTNIKVPIKDARRLVEQNRESVTADAPVWVNRWVWDCESDQFVNTDTKNFISMLSFNARYDRLMAAFANGDGDPPKASDMALNHWRIDVVDRTIYNPVADLMYYEGGLRYLNLYRPDTCPQMPIEMTEGDRRAVAILVEHTEILIPDERERTLFLDYLAYCIQKPGAKIRWAPLLKGVEGDGKSAFVVMMIHCLGHQNVRVLDSSTLESSNFTSWGAGQCFTGVEEIKLHGHNKYDIYNKLKPYLSNDFIEIHKKSKDPYNVPNTTNYMLLTNFEDGVPVTDNDRRVMFLRSPFMSKEAMFDAVVARTGLQSREYFDRLFDQCIKAHPGALRKWFMERELSPEFSADGRAPITAARSEAVDLSVKESTYSIEAILEEGGLGIYPNIISIRAVHTALRERMGLNISPASVPRELIPLGFKYIGKQIKWRGEVSRFYVRGDLPPGSIQTYLEGLEKERQDLLIEDQFND